MILGFAAKIQWFELIFAFDPLPLSGSLKRALTNHLLQLVPAPLYGNPLWKPFMETPLRLGPEQRFNP